MRWLAFSAALFLSACSNVVKLHNENLPAEAEAQVFSFVNGLGVRYMNGRNIRPADSRAYDVYHLKPGTYSFVLVRFDNRIKGAYHETKFAMFEVTATLEANVTYVPWSDDFSMFPKQVCLVAEPRAIAGQDVRDYGWDRAPSPQGRKVACGKQIDATKYMEQHGMP